MRQLEAFKKLLMNKKFIHTMVKTLEGNPQKFGIPDRYSLDVHIFIHTFKVKTVMEMNYFLNGFV